MTQIGVVTSAVQFFRQIGSTVGVAVFGSLLTNDINGKIAIWARGRGLPPMDLSGLRDLSAGTQIHGGALNLPDQIRAIVTSSVTHVIFLSLIVVFIALCATIMIPALPLRDRPAMAKNETVPADAHL